MSLPFRYRILKSIISLLAKKHKLKKIYLNKVEHELLSFEHQGYLQEIGWIASFNTNKCIDLNNKPLPWVTYPFIDFISERLNNKVKVFEFGSGYSTLYYSSKVSSVTSVEHDSAWYNKIKDMMPSNVKLMFKSFEYNGEYCRTAEAQSEKFDLIIIDGRDRVNCCLNSLIALSQDGIVVLDDSDRNAYLPGINFLLGEGFKKIDFWGISPGFINRKCTSVFYRSENVLGI